MPRCDGPQYDSVKSYKAFLKQVAQTHDLDVEVKEVKSFGPFRSKSLDHCVKGFPLKSKSVEHCVVVEEESSERSEGKMAAAGASVLNSRRLNAREVRYKHGGFNSLGLNMS